MKVPTLALLGSALAVDTITSTLVLSTCSLVIPAFSSYANSTAGDTTIYETDVVTNDATQTAVKTICHNGNCRVTTEVDVLTTVVATVNGVLTTYVTAVPVSTPSPTAQAVATETNVATTVVTVTSCKDDKCSKTAVTTGVTVVPTTVNGVLTMYTTYCPLPSAAAPSSVAAGSAPTRPAPAPAPASSAPAVSIPNAPSAPAPADHTFTETKASVTVVTVTSCSDNKCSATPVTTGLTAVTTTINGFATVYTTFCPVSAVPETPKAESAQPTLSVGSSAPAVSAPESTVNVITNNIVTQLTLVSQATLSTVAAISTFEAGAGRALPVAALAAPLLLLL